MRIGTMLGTLLLLLGAYIGLRGLNYTSRRSVVEVGDFKASVQEERNLPPWIGGALAVVGAGLIGFSVRGRGKA